MNIFRGNERQNQYKKRQRQERKRGVEREREEEGEAYKSQKETEILFYGKLYINALHGVYFQKLFHENFCCYVFRFLELTVMEFCQQIGWVLQNIEEDEVFYRFLFIFVVAFFTFSHFHWIRLMNTGICDEIYNKYFAICGCLRMRVRKIINQFVRNRMGTSIQVK